jgi:hypothetical protein
MSVRWDGGLVAGWICQLLLGREGGKGKAWEGVGITCLGFLIKTDGFHNLRGLGFGGSGFGGTEFGAGGSVYQH